MDLLLDTHTFIWFIDGDQNLSRKTVSKIKDVENECFLSIASVWEMAIKVKLGKLRLRSNFDEIMAICDENAIAILPITFEHIQTLNTLDFHHRDPFDRLIIAQSLTESLTIVTKDENFKSYKIKSLW